LQSIQATSRMTGDHKDTKKKPRKVHQTKIIESEND